MLNTRQISVELKARVSDLSPWSMWSWRLTRAQYLLASPCQQRNVVRIWTSLAHTVFCSYLPVLIKWCFWIPRSSMGGGGTTLEASMRISPSSIFGMPCETNSAGTCVQVLAWCPGFRSCLIYRLFNCHPLNEEAFSQSLYLVLHKTHLPTPLTRILITGAAASKIRWTTIFSAVYNSMESSSDVLLPSSLSDLMTSYTFTAYFKINRCLLPRLNKMTSSEDLHVFEWIFNCRRTLPLPFDPPQNLVLQL